MKLLPWQALEELEATALDALERVSKQRQVLGLELQSDLSDRVEATKTGFDQALRGLREQIESAVSAHDRLEEDCIEAAEQNADAEARIKDEVERVRTQLQQCQVPVTQDKFFFHIVDTHV